MHKICVYLLDERRKKWYDDSMENNMEINRRIAKNLTHYRKAAGLTQAGLADKINYSDKSVSKWESGNGVPDIYTLMQLAELYGVSVDALIGDGTPVSPHKKSVGLHILIMLLSSALIWLVATCFYVMMQLLPFDGPWWLAFIYSIPINAILLIVYSGVWHYRTLNFLSVSTLIWMAITCLFLTTNIVSEDPGRTWLLFLLGIPLQVLETLWVFFRFTFRKTRKVWYNIIPKTKMKKDEKTDGE